MGLVGISVDDFYKMVDEVSIALQMGEIISTSEAFNIYCRRIWNALITRTELLFIGGSVFYNQFQFVMDLM